MRQDYSELLFSEMSTFWSHELEKLLYLSMLHSGSYRVEIDFKIIYIDKPIFI